MDVGLDIVHRVDNPEAVVNGATGGVNVEFNIFLWVFMGEEEELGNDEVGGMGIDVFAEEDDAVFQETRVNVVGALTTISLLDNRRDEVILTRRGRGGLKIGI